jgi:beta-lactamase regulating signal transducer with metallopeptidase domain
MESNILIYLLKANLALVVLYILFLVLFQRTTFHLANRVILLFILVFSLFAPFLGYNFFSVSENVFVLTNWIESVDNFPIDWQSAEPLVSSANTMSFLFYVFLVYLTGFVIMLFRFVSQLKNILVLKRNATKSTNDTNTFYIEGSKLPFTFMNWVFLPKKDFDIKGLNFILKHENAHAKQLHTLDNLLAELVCIAFWFNPFVFLLKRSLKSVHEYLADNAAVEYDKEKIYYLKLLVNDVGFMPTNGISSNFYWLTIKKRINMITKNKTSRIRTISYLLVVPVIALMIQSFSNINISARGGLKTVLSTDNNVPNISPIKSDLVKKTSGYGMRMHPLEKVEKMHYGIDFSAEEDTPVLATADGIVVKVEFLEEGKGYGRVVVIEHSKEYSTLYSQLSGFNVSEGDMVKQGQIIGLVGSSGISTGPHLHYEVHKNGERVNPENYFER